MFNASEARDRIRNFIEENMDVFNDAEEVRDEDNIFEKGYVNSMFAMRLLQFIEKEFSVEVSDDDIDLKNFSTINRMIGLVSKLKEGQ